MNEVVSTSQLRSPADLQRDEITAQLRGNSDLIFEFTRRWYRSPYTFLATRFLGHHACKMPTDLWIFHDLFYQYRFKTVIETGTAGGGATLWFAMLMDVLGLGHVYSIDVAPDEKLPKHPRITFLTGSSTDPEMLKRVNLEPPILVDLDSSHFAPHVTAELELWAPHVPLGSWIVVEDTNGAPVVKDPVTGDDVPVEGAMAGMYEYLARHPGEFIHDAVCERYWLTMNPRGWLQRVKEYGA